MKQITGCGHDIPTLLTLDDSGAKYTYIDHISSICTWKFAQANFVWCLEERT